MVVERNEIETDVVTGLPRWPYRNRRKLEEQWLAALEQHGIEAFVDGPLGDPPNELLRAVDQFDSGEFWGCHETLEDTWRETPYPFRLFYHAIIKISVGFHHLSVHNRNGAHAKLSDGVSLLRIFQPEWLGVRNDLLLADASEWLSLVETTAVDWSELDGYPRPRIVAADDQDVSG